MKILKLVLVFLFGFMTSATHAQEARHHGCHHHNKAGVKRNALTSMEKVLLNQSIARSDTFDILSYLIHIDVTNYAAQQIVASTTVRFRALMPGQSSIRFDLYQLQVDSVLYLGESLGYSYANNILQLNFNSTLATSDTASVTVYYQGHPYQDPTWGGFYFESNYIYSLGIGLTTIPPNFGKVWYPCFDSFVERALYEYHVKSAGTYRAHCQGTFLGETVLAADTVIRSFAFNQPIPTHCSAIAVADYVDYDYTHMGAYGNIPVRLTAKPGQIDAMQTKFEHLNSAIDACEYWYGPYAWERVGYVLTTDGALEIPTNIAYPQYMTGESLATNDGLISHELGHHWWGDMVTPHNHNDMWLKEGPAEYSSHLMVEWMNGDSAFVANVKTNHLDVLKNAHLEDGDFYPMSPMPDPVIYGTHTYYKGASVVHNLRGYMGDDLFRQAMTGVQSDHQYEDITPEQFRDYLEEESGVDLHSFFDDQVFSPGFSVFVVDSFASNVNGSNFDVRFYLQQKLRACPQYYSNVPLDITLIGENWQRSNYQVTASGQFSDFMVSASFIPKLVVVNGFNRLNQARMDYEFKVFPNVSIYPVLPYVDFRFTKVNVQDSSLVRVDHIWAAPDQNNLGDGIYEISNVHYWNVSGLWQPGDFFTSKFYYYGSSNTKLDYDLYNNSEQNAVLLYRPSSHVPWEVCPGFTMGSGSLSNGDGFFNLDTLRIGQYAFANGDASVAVNDIILGSNKLWLYPVPASESLKVKGNYPTRETAIFDILALDGKLMIRSSGVVENNFEKTIQTSYLESGMYILRVRTAKGEHIGTQQFEVIHH